MRGVASTSWGGHREVFSILKLRESSYFVLDVGGGGARRRDTWARRRCMALFVRRRRVLSSGTPSRSSRGHITVGPFNLDRERATASFRALAELDADVACFGTAPVAHGASDALTAASTDPKGL